MTIFGFSVFSFPSFSTSIGIGIGIDLDLDAAIGIRIGIIIGIVSVSIGIGILDLVPIIAILANDIDIRVLIGYRLGITVGVPIISVAIGLCICIIDDIVNVVVVFAFGTWIYCFESALIHVSEFPLPQVFPCANQMMFRTCKIAIVIFFIYRQHDLQDIPNNQDDIAIETRKCETECACERKNETIWLFHASQSKYNIHRTGQFTAQIISVKGCYLPFHLTSPRPKLSGGVVAVLVSNNRPVV